MTLQQAIVAALLNSEAVGYRLYPWAVKDAWDQVYVIDKKSAYNSMKDDWIEPGNKLGCPLN